MKGGNQRLGQRRVPQQPLNALAHLAGGLVGKGDRKNRIRRHAFFVDEPRDAAGDDARLARAGSGQDQQRTFRRLHGGALFGIQIVDERLQGESPAGRFLLQCTVSRGMKFCFVEAAVSTGAGRLCAQHDASAILNQA